MRLVQRFVEKTSREERDRGRTRDRERERERVLHGGSFSVSTPFHPPSLFSVSPIFSLSFFFPLFLFSFSCNIGASPVARCNLGWVVKILTLCGPRQFIRVLVSAVLQGIIDSGFLLMRPREISMDRCFSTESINSARVSTFIYDVLRIRPLRISTIVERDFSLDIRNATCSNCFTILSKMIEMYPSFCSCKKRRPSHAYGYSGSV